MSTLFQLVRGIPDFGGRVYLAGTDDSSALATPYAIVDEITGGPISPYYNTAAVSAVYPEVTIYCKAASGQVPAQAFAQVNALIDVILALLPGLTSDSAGRPYVVGSVQRANEPRPLADTKVPGERMATIKFSAAVFRN